MLIALVKRSRLKENLFEVALILAQPCWTGNSRPLSCIFRSNATSLSRGSGEYLLVESWSSVLLRSVGSTEAVSTAWRSAAFMRAIRCYRKRANGPSFLAKSRKQAVKDRCAALRGRHRVVIVQMLIAHLKAFLLEHQLLSSLPTTELAHAIDSLPSL